MSAGGDATAIVDEEMAEAHERFDIPVIAYGLVHEGHVVHMSAVASPGHCDVGPMTRFRVSSLTKSVTAATVLLLADRGLLDVRRPVSDVLPWATCLRWQGNQAILIDHLLTMTSGLPADDPWVDEWDDLQPDQLARMLADDARLVRPPGSKYEYSNVGFALLGQIISAVTGVDYRDVVAAEILDPIGMHATGFDVPDVMNRVVGHRVIDGELVPTVDEIPLGAFAPSGGLWSCAYDVALWIASLESAAAGEPSPLPTHVVRELIAPRVVIRLDTRLMASEGSVTAQNYAHGLHAPEYSDIGRVIAHQGGSPGFGADMRWHPLTRWGVVAMGNRGYALVQAPSRRSLHRIVGPIVDDAMAVAMERSLLPATRKAIDWAESLLAHWDDREFERLASSTLDRQMPRQVREDLFARVATQRGPFARDQTSLESVSPTHARWRMRGERGDAWLDILLTPAGEPRVQHLALLDDPGDSRIW